MRNLKYPFQQGYLDSLCGIYSMLNANRLVNNVSYENSQPLFNYIISFLYKKRLLQRVIIEGINHRNFSNLMNAVGANLFPLMEANKKGFSKLNEWWEYTKQFMEEKPNRAVILSIGGLHDHLTVIQKMTDKMMILFDSDGFKTIRKSSCKIQGYSKPDKYVIYYSQCWYLGKE